MSIGAPRCNLADRELLGMSLAFLGALVSGRKRARGRTMRCVICHDKKATVPDRNMVGRAPRLCHDCHANRLAGDMRRILALRQQAERKRRARAGQ